MLISNEEFTNRHLTSTIFFLKLAFPLLSLHTRTRNSRQIRCPITRSHYGVATVCNAALPELCPILAIRIEEPQANIEMSRHSSQSASDAELGRIEGPNGHGVHEHGRSIKGR